MNMAARAIWKGVIRWGNAGVPVKLYSAIQEQRVHFRLLHDRDRAPVTQRMVEPDTGEAVASEEVRKGVPVARGRFVLVTDAELESIEPKESRDIDIVRVVPTAALDHAYYDRAYWLGPDGDSGSYWALVEALSREAREGIARWVMRKRSYIGALRRRGDHLVLITLRHLGEVIEPKEMEPPAGRAPDRREIDMAAKLVGMLEGPFEPADYRDEYRERVLEFVRKKARGTKIRLARKPPKRAASDLTQALQRSLAAAAPAAAGAKRARRRAHG
jgi:DNA end-binding protein Ku